MWYEIQRKIIELKVRISLFRNGITRRQALFLLALNAVGTDVSPLDFVTDDLGCAESVSALLKKVIPFRTITGTWTLWDTLRRDTRFIEMQGEPRRGDIILSPTGTGNGLIRGHVGIYGPDKSIMSATSDDGVWRYNYTEEKWRSRFEFYGGMQSYIYRLI